MSGEGQRPQASGFVTLAWTARKRTAVRVLHGPNGGEQPTNKRADRERGITPCKGRSSRRRGNADSVAGETIAPHSERCESSEHVHRSG